MGVFICIDIGIAICLRMYVSNYIIVLFYPSTCIPNSSHLISSLQTLGHGLIAHRALQEWPIMANPSFCLQLVSYNDTERCCQLVPNESQRLAFFLQFWMLSFAKWCVPGQRFSPIPSDHLSGGSTDFYSCRKHHETNWYGNPNNKHRPTITMDHKLIVCIVLWEDQKVRFVEVDHCKTSHNIMLVGGVKPLQKYEIRLVIIIPVIGLATNHPQVYQKWQVSTTKWTMLVSTHPVLPVALVEPRSLPVPCRVVGHWRVTHPFSSNFKVG